VPVTVAEVSVTCRDATELAHMTLLETWIFSAMKETKALHKNLFEYILFPLIKIYITS
jgi:hypothetical protein